MTVTLLNARPVVPLCSYPSTSKHINTRTTRTSEIVRPTSLLLLGGARHLIMAKYGRNIVGFVILCALLGSAEVHAGMSIDSTTTVVSQGSHYSFLYSSSGVYGYHFFSTAIIFLSMPRTEIATEFRYFIRIRWVLLSRAPYATSTSTGDSCLTRIPALEPTA